MQLCKLQREPGWSVTGVVVDGQVYYPDVEEEDGDGPSLGDLLHASHPAAAVRGYLNACTREMPLASATLLAPVDRQEIWAAGVTYKRSREARERESEGAAKFYDLVYSAERPELFFKATPERVVGPGEPVRVRADSRWSVPEPELTLVLSPDLRLVGYTIGNDMSARDIEGENPLYLPQAKIYSQSCAVGPVITLAGAFPPLDQVTIRLQIHRKGKPVFDGSTSLSAMKRTFDDLIAWLGRENSFLTGAMLLTGTGIVPPDDFTLAVDDVIDIDITGIGRLSNFVMCG